MWRLKRFKEPLDGAFWGILCFFFFLLPYSQSDPVIKALGGSGAMFPRLWLALWSLLLEPPDSGQMLLGALEITGFLAQHDSLEPLGLLRQCLQYLTPKLCLFLLCHLLIIGSLLSVSYHLPVVPCLFFYLPQCFGDSGWQEPQRLHSK